MSKLTEVVLSRRKTQEKYFESYLGWAKIIKKEAERFLGGVRLFIFGSILRREEVPRDIDILIISPKLRTAKKKREIKVKIWQKIGIFSPFEIHLVTPQEYSYWYKNFIKEKVEV